MKIFLKEEGSDKVRKLVKENRLLASGIERMRELLCDAGLKEPVFEMDAFFRVTFYRDPRYSLKADKETAEKTMGKGLVEKGGEDTEKIRRKLGEKLGENEKRILKIINKNKFITIPELSNSTMLSRWH